MQMDRVDSRGLFFPQDSDQAIPLKGMDVATLFTWASRLQHAGRTAVAITLYKNWIAFNFDSPILYAVYFNFAVALSNLDDQIGAVNAYREAMRLKPNFLPPHVNLGRVLETLGGKAEAMTAWLAGLGHVGEVTGEALTHKVTMLTQLARVLEDSHQDPAAEDALRQVIELTPDNQEAILHWVGLRQRQCKWPTVTPFERTSVADLLGAGTPLTLANITDDPLFQLGAAYAYGASAVRAPTRSQLAQIRSRIAASKSASSRIRVGYVSSDLREHAVGFCLPDLFETHDKSRVEIFAYQCGPERDDPTSRRFMQAADHWLDINPLNDFDAACRIADDGVEILIDVNGFTKFARTGVFAFRPAPIIVNWFGYPGTMGTPYHHYLIADPVIIPPEYERFYSEEIVRLPCYQPNDRKRVVSPVTPTRADVGLPDDAFVFCSFNGTQKLTRRMFECWLRILARAEGSVLWMLTGSEPSNAQLRQYAAERGIAPERIVFADKRRNPEHLARYPLADLFLDSFPYGAHTTASDSLWMGVPIVTLQGRCFAARVCSSLLEAAGLRELVTQTESDYVDLACALAADRSRVAEIKRRLREGRDRMLLFDTRRLTSSLEQAFFAMRERHSRGLTPRPDLRNLPLYHRLGASLNYEQIEAASDADYFAVWRDALAEHDASYPIEADGRLWAP